MRKLPGINSASKTDLAVLLPYRNPGAIGSDSLGFARWLVSGKHPLTARVAVNRYWQMYFGDGIVRHDLCAVFTHGEVDEDAGVTLRAALCAHFEVLDCLRVAAR